MVPAVPVPVMQWTLGVVRVPHVTLLGGEYVPPVVTVNFCAAGAALHSASPRLATVPEGSAVLTPMLAVVPWPARPVMLSFCWDESALSTSASRAAVGT